jgi:bidirectional [NiFe] hydrogenase diaphorase subunit
MDLAELHAIAERERQTPKPIRIRCCVAAGCLSANAQAVKQRLEESVAGADPVANRAFVY